MTTNQYPELSDAGLLTKMERIQKNGDLSECDPPGMVVAIPTQHYWLVGYNFNNDLDTTLFTQDVDVRTYGFRSLGEKMMHIHSTTQDVSVDEIIYRRLVAALDGHDQTLYRVLDRLESNGCIKYDLKI